MFLIKLIHRFTENTEPVVYPFFFSRSFSRFRFERARPLWIFQGFKAAAQFTRGTGNNVFQSFARTRGHPIFSHIYIYIYIALIGSADWTLKRIHVRLHFYISPWGVKKASKTLFDISSDGSFCTHTACIRSLRVSQNRLPARVRFMRNFKGRLASVHLLSRIRPRIFATAPTFSRIRTDENVRSSKNLIDKKVTEASPLFTVKSRGEVTVVPLTQEAEDMSRYLR